MQIEPLPKNIFFCSFAFVNLFFFLFIWVHFFLNIVHKKIADDTTERLVCEPKRCIWPDVSPGEYPPLCGPVLFFSSFFFPLMQHFWRKVRSCGPFSRVGATQMPEGELPKEGENNWEQQNGAAIWLNPSTAIWVTQVHTYTHLIAGTHQREEIMEKRSSWQRGNKKNTGGQLTKMQVHICLRCEVEWSVIRSST